jgi:hypothetical protein
MDFFQTYAKELVALLVPFVTWLLNAPQRHKPRLVRGTRHAFTFLLHVPQLDEQGNQVKAAQNVLTASVMIQNIGKVTAKNVEIVFNWKPQYLNMWPSRHIEEKTEADGRYCLMLSSLAPGEYLGMELLAINASLPQLITVRSDECVAIEVQMEPQPVRPVWKQRSAIFLQWFGLAAAAYAVLVILQWLVLKTPA